LGEPISEPSEIYSIGVTLYESLTRRLPYGEIEPFQTPTFGRAKPLRRLNQAVPGWFESIVMRAIEPKKERRYAHYSEMDYDLANPHKVKPWFDPSRPLIEREPAKVYRIAFLVSFLINLILLALLLQ
jgi:serine/threonine protein kinase